MILIVNEQTICIELLSFFHVLASWYVLTHINFNILISTIFIL